MPKHVGVKKLKNTLTVHCAFVSAIKPLMYQNARSERCNSYKNLTPLCGCEIWICIRKGRTAVCGLLMFGAEEKEVI